MFRQNRFVKNLRQGDRSDRRCSSASYRLRSSVGSGSQLAHGRGPDNDSIAWLKLRQCHPAPTQIFVSGLTLGRAGMRAAV